MSPDIDTPEYQKFVEEMAVECHCYPIEVRPCDGLLAGGPCDRQGEHHDTEFYDNQDRMGEEA